LSRLAPDCLTLGDGLRIALRTQTLPRPCADHEFTRLRTGLSVACTSSSAPSTDCSVSDAWRSIQLEDCSTGCIVRPYVACGLLRRQHFEVLRRARCTPCSTLITPHRSRVYRLPDRSGVGFHWLRHLTLRSVRGLLRTRHLAPGISRGVLLDSHLDLHLCSVLGPCGLPESTSRMKPIKFAGQPGMKITMRLYYRGCQRV